MSLRNKASVRTHRFFQSSKLGSINRAIQRREFCPARGLKSWCLLQVLFQDGRLQWKRLENLISLAQEGSAGLDLSDTVRDGARVVLMDDRLRTQLLMALTEGDRLHVAVGPLWPLGCVYDKLWQTLSGSLGLICWGWRGHGGPVRCWQVCMSNFRSTLHDCA